MHGAGQPVDVVDRRALAIQRRGLGLRPDQAVEVAALELVGVPGQRLQIADAVVAGAGPEDSRKVSAQSVV